VVDYGMGNLRSVAKALEAAGCRAVVSGDPRELARCRGIVLPGVGAFRDCMAALGRQGLSGFLREAADSGRPFLGICLGLQVLFGESEEFGRHEGLGVFEGRVVRFPPGLAGPGPGGGHAPLKVPHMGWNRVDVVADHPLFRGIPPGSYFYFVHSYHVVPRDESCVACRTEYGISFVSGVARGRLAAVQFHPEKSQRAGLALLANFGALCREAASQGADA